MEHNKPYTDPELSLGRLAAQLSLSPTIFHKSSMSSLAKVSGIL
jgi:hypothetical protein